MSTTVCPRCGHRRSNKDSDTHEGICPGCGIAYAKWIARNTAGSRSTPRTQQADAVGTETAALLPRLREQLLLPPEGTDATGMTWRAVLLAALGVWTLWFAAHGIDWEVIGGSFLHNANLAFHEFGHVFFRPFGPFMTILGGSLFQVAMPLLLAGYFAGWTQDNVAAAAALWWCGQNLVDVAPYIRDAEYRVLPLVGGGGEESHDWGNLLTQLDAVPACYALARTSFGVGLLIMCAALAWGGAVLWRWRREAAGGGP